MIAPLKIPKVVSCFICFCWFVLVPDSVILGESVGSNGPYLLVSSPIAHAAISSHLPFVLSDICC